MKSYHVFIIAGLILFGIILGGVLFTTHRSGYRDGREEAFAEMRLRDNCKQSYHGRDLLETRAKEIAYMTCRNVAICIVVDGRQVDCESITCKRCEP